MFWLIIGLMLGIYLENLILGVALGLTMVFVTDFLTPIKPRVRSPRIASVRDLHKF